MESGIGAGSSLWLGPSIFSEMDGHLYQGGKAYFHALIGLMMIGIGGVAISFAIDFHQKLPVEQLAWLGVLGAAPILAGLSMVWGAAGHMPYKVRVEDEGLWVERRGRGKLHPWRSIRAVREKSFSERIELDIEGQSAPVFIHHDIERFDELLLVLLERISWLHGASAESPVVLRGSYGRDLAIIVALIAFLSWAALYEAPGRNTWLIASIVLGLGFYRLRRYGISRLELDAEGLTARTLVGARQIPWGDIAQVDIALEQVSRGMATLALRVELDDGETIRPTPGGVDLFSAYRALKSAAPQRIFAPAH